MKRILLVAILSCLYINSIAQVEVRIPNPTRIGLFGGAGLATSNNYDLGISAGLDFDKMFFFRTTFGASVFLQGYSLYYDNEANSAKHKQGDAGYILRTDSKYVFFTPQIKYIMAHKVNLITWVNVSAGIGMKMSGYDSVKKWDHTFDQNNPLRYDSTIDASKNMNSMLLRFGVGFTQDFYIGRGDFWFTLKEDFGFIAGSLVTTGESAPGVTPYSPQKLNPGYVSLQLGITYIKPKKYKS